MRQDFGLLSPSCKASKAFAFSTLKLVAATGGPALLNRGICISNAGGRDSAQQFTEQISKVSKKICQHIRSALRFVGSNVQFSCKNLASDTKQGQLSFRIFDQPFGKIIRPSGHHFLMLCPTQRISATCLTSFHNPADLSCFCLSHS